MKNQDQLIQEAYVSMVYEGKFIETHKGEDDFGLAKPNPKHPAYSKHKAEYDTKRAEMKETTFSLKDKEKIATKTPEENPVKFHMIDDAISNSYPDSEPYEHLARKFPSLHNQIGKNGSKLTDLADKAVRDNTKYKSMSDYIDDTFKQFKDDQAADERINK